MLAVMDDVREAVSSKTIASIHILKGLNFPVLYNWDWFQFLERTARLFRKNHRQRTINLLPMITETKETACTTFVQGPSSISRH